MRIFIDLYNRKRQKKSQIRVSGSSFVLQNMVALKALCFSLLLLSVLAFIKLQSESFSKANATPNYSVDVLRENLQQNFSQKKNILQDFIQSNPDNFLKLEGQEIATLFEVPELAWSEPPTMVWQYKAQECVLDIYMASMDNNIATAPIVHYEARDFQGQVYQDVSKCISQIVLRKTNYNKNFTMISADKFIKPQENN